MSCGRRSPHEERLFKKRSKDLDKINKLDRKLDKHITRLLLLGCGDSGKSTFLKQMKVSQQVGFSRNEKVSYMVALKTNTFKSMKNLVAIAEEAGVMFNENIMENIEIFRSHTELNEECAFAIKSIWDDVQFKSFYEEFSHSFKVPTCTPYYFENAVRYATNFKPNNEDIFRAKRKTTGVFEIEFTYNDHTFRMIDVGGQRSERRKWMHCFTDVTAIIFLASLDGYNMCLEEDEQTNRMTESLEVFHDVATSKLTANSALILFLNKYDIFKKQIEKYPLSEVFDNAPEGMGVDESYQFILQKYLNEAGTRRVYPFKTCALDTMKCARVFESITEDILRKIFNKAGVVF